MIFPREKKLTISNYFFVYFSSHLWPGYSVPKLSKVTAYVSFDNL